jgi:hypothetical protein
LDAILEQEIKKDINMRSWEQGGTDPAMQQMQADRIKKEVERRITEADNI